MKHPEDVAKTIIEIFKNRTKGMTSRFQMSFISIARIVETDFVSFEYLNHLKLAFHNEGWAVIQTTQTMLGFIKISKTESWLKISTKKI